jgi:hypothetical protein
VAFLKDQNREPTESIYIEKAEGQRWRFSGLGAGACCGSTSSNSVLGDHRGGLDVLNSESGDTPDGLLGLVRPAK